MDKSIEIISSPENLNSSWDNLADFYFQKKEFLIHLHKYNPCAQRYYELYRGNTLVAGTVVYTLKTDILTFANIPSPIKFQVIGLPVSVATPPIIGNSNEFEYLLSEILKTESGLIVGLNFLGDYVQNKVLNLRTLPTIILTSAWNSIESYEHSLRHAYRRRMHKIRQKFAGVTSITTDCSIFNEEHYALYIEIMKKTTTKLETLSPNVFKYLPLNFRLTTYYMEKKMLCWHTVCKDQDTLFFFFGGMNYSLRDQYHSYYNNLFGIMETAIELGYNRIDFGQTAEIAKTRLGGTLSERRMFLYHKNSMILGLLKFFGKLISYSKTIEKCQVFKNED